MRRTDSGGARKYAPVQQRDIEEDGEDGVVALEVPVVLEFFEESPSTLDWTWYAAHCLWEQFRIVAAIGAYLFVTAVVLLEQPLPGFGELCGMIVGVGATVVGLGAFLEGLRFGVMPLGEAVGTLLPRHAPLHVTLLVSLVLGVGVTFAEPAVSALEAVGETVDGTSNPYLWYMLNHWTAGLVAAVGAGVGSAAVVGTLRFLRGWTFKRPLAVALPITLVATCMFYALAPDEANGIVALAWDCGAVTTGPVTVPIVLALGVGVVSAAGQEASPLASFGLVTLASLFPVVTVLILATLMIWTVDVADIIAIASSVKAHRGHALSLDSPLAETVMACRALMPLVGFLACVLVLGLRQPLPIVSIRREATSEAHTKISVWPGLVTSLLGLIVFNVGLTYGLEELGELAGKALPAAFTNIASVQSSPLLPHGLGIAAVLLFAFVLGIGATSAEPALKALGLTVARLTEGRFPPQVVNYAVPIGVALGLVAGISKVLGDVSVFYFVLPLYPLAAVLTVPSDDDLAAIAWDSAGVTTGPVTVPLVLALGAGLADAADARTGFGLLTMASICPITVVLVYGLLRQCFAEPAARAATPEAGRCEELEQGGASATTGSRTPAPGSRSESPAERLDLVI